VETEPGQGTTFKLYFPQVPELAAAVPPPAPTEMPKGTETVLLVEDDPTLRTLTRHILRGCGYTLLEASDGPDAVRVAEDHAGPIHLLLTDLVMPHLGGRQVAERVVAIKPGVKVLYCSGDAEDTAVRHGMLEKGTAFIQKPYFPAQLARKVRDLLDGRV
jgi:CheY-like chemotaxis protein